MKTEEEIAAGNNTLKLILRRINQPTIEPMEAILPEYLALECKFLNFTSFSHCLDRFPILGAG